MSPIAPLPLDDLLSPRPVLQASLFCLAVDWDVQGRVTIGDAFHTLERGPAPDFFLVNLWRYDHPQAGTFQEVLAMRDPDGRILGDLRTPPFMMGGDIPRHFNYIRFNDIQFVTAGTHETHIALLNAEDGSVVTLSRSPLLIV